MPLCARAALLLLTSVAWAAAGCGDRLHISGAQAGAEVGVLIDGRDGAGDLNDRGAVTRGADLALGDLTAGTTNEVIGFNNGHPPRLRTTPWTAGGDRFNLDFEPAIAIPVVVWIVKGPFEPQRDRAYAACTRTSAIWYAERMGVRFSDFAVIDATKNGTAAQHFHFPQGGDPTAAFLALAQEIGFVPKRLNIYWVQTVSGLSGSALSDFKAQIAMGEDTSDDVLVHEIGHAFSLTHPPLDSCDFNQENVMAGSGSDRRFFTEGQLFRAHLNPKSALNDLYAARPNEVVRFCHPCLANAQCPALQRRLWADGRFSPY